MIARAKTSWRQLAEQKPGRRFQERYRYRKRLRRERAKRYRRRNVLLRVDYARVLYIGLGLALIVLSAFGGWLPVLGWGTAILGFGLIAGEIEPAARLMDWLEVRARKVLRPVWRTYLRLPRWAQVVSPVVVAGATFALVYWLFSVVLGG